MTVSILGCGAVGSLAGGLLSLYVNDVRFEGIGSGSHARGRIRMVMPDRWLLSNEIGAGPPRDPDFLLVTLGRHHLRALRRDAFKNLIDRDRGHAVFFNCDPGEPERLGFDRAARTLVLTLMEAVKVQELDVELLTEKPVFVIEKGSPADALLQGFTSHGVRVLPVDDTTPYLNSFFVFQLLSLPVALCNTTLAHFLSFPEGRELARNLLSEGIAAMEKADRKTMTLPLMDPRELLMRLERDPARFESARFAPGRSFSPTLRAFFRGSAAESRELNKRAVELAATVALQLPWNWKVFQKAGRAVGVGYFKDPAELVKSLD